MSKRVLSFKVSLLLGLSALVFTYQHCSNVVLEKNMQVSLNANKLQARFCFPYGTDQYSKYVLSEFYFINLTARARSEGIVGDSDLNGDTDDLQQEAKTVFISDLDSDADGLPDFVEKLKGLNPSRDDLDEDGLDHDGVTNKREIQLGTDPQSENKTSETIYNVQESFDRSDCGIGQKAYEISLAQVETVKTSSFDDSVNQNSLYNLSHGENENVYLLTRPKVI